MKYPPAWSVALRRTAPAAAFSLWLASLASAQPTPTTPARPDAPATPAVQPVPAETERPANDDVIVLSPFEVNSSNDRGYFAENTLAGSRLNTSVADLANSITVVTKQQMQDTGSIDLNDIFLYEANTEGTGNYTDFAVDSRGAVQDRSAGFQGGAPGVNSSPATANRVRGIGAVDKMRDFYPSNLRLPFDVYNTDSVEINRGPSSLLFGLGSAAGIVNQTSSRANLTRTSTHVDFRIDDRGGYRAAFNLNRPLIEDKLAIYLAAVRDERGFERKPSHDETNRFYGAVTAKPFEKTTIRGSIERYDNRNRRPNSVTPRDFVTPWIAAGRPSYNPVTGLLTVNGVTTGPYSGATAIGQTTIQDASGSTVQFDVNQRPVQMIDQGEPQLWIMRQLSSTPSAAGTPATFTFNSPIRATKSQGPRTRFNQIVGRPAGLTFSQPGVTDQSLYDWENINILSSNHGEDEAWIYNVELEQEIIKNLHLQVGWYREDFNSDVQYYLSQQTGVTLYVDTNSVNLDGTPNANFGRTFVETTSPDRFLHPEVNTTGRATLAYLADLTTQDSWLRHLGRHNFMGLWSLNKVEREQHRLRPYLSSNNLFTPVVADIWAGNTTQNVIERRMFVGGTDSLVSQDPGYFDNVSRTGTLRWFNPTTNAWENTTVQEDTALHFVSSASWQEIESTAAAAQSYWFDDRIVTTFGWRRDESEAANTAGLTRLPNGLTNPTNLGVFTAPQLVAGETTTLGAVVRPFKWSGIKSLDQGGSVLSDFVRSLSVTYNKSDNFAPAGPGTDFYGNFLPFPTGEGEDYGIGFSLWGDKLVARVNFFEATQANARGALIAQAVSRTYAIDDALFRAWATHTTGGTNISAPAVYNVLQLPAVHSAAAAHTFFGLPTATTTTVDAKGLEFQLTYNPTRNWTLKFAAGRQETIYSAIGPEWNAWVADRRPLWESASAPGFTNFWAFTGQQFVNAGISTNGFNLGATETVADWFFSNIDAVVRTGQRLSGKVSQDQREWRWSLITNYQFDSGPLKNFAVGGGIRWEDEAAIGYLGSAPDADGLIRSLDVDKPVFDDSEYHVDVWASYTFRGLPWIGDDVRTKIQLNVRDVLENGGLKPIAVNPDGQASAFRIVDPRQVFLSVAFDF